MSGKRQFSFLTLSQLHEPVLIVFLSRGQFWFGCDPAFSIFTEAAAVGESHKESIEGLTDLCCCWAALLFSWEQ